LTLPWLMVE